jgi:hypothetical protein
MYPTEKSPKISKNFNCICCDYNCCKLSEYNKHLLTNKHKILQNPTQLNTQKLYKCICGKNYKHSSTLYAHKKKNNCQENIMSLNILIDDKLTINTNDGHQQLIEYLLKENSEFKQLMIDQNKQMLEQNKSMVEIAKTAGNNNNNSTNNNFNLNFFLNETCKNAMNIMDFVAQLQVGIKELEDTGRLGFSEGISKIFINGLKQLDISDRPIHCSDSKREVVYIKDKDQWNKETEDKTILTNAIKHVAHKNMKQISEWTKGNPEFNDSTSKQNDRYLNIVCESMSGSSQEETNKNYNKIIKNIVKGTIIDKDTISVT